jgi:hypothetical protein
MLLLGAGGGGSSLLGGLVAYAPLSQSFNGYWPTSQPVSGGSGTYDMLAVSTVVSPANGLPYASLTGNRSSLQMSNLPWATLVNGFTVAFWANVPNWSATGAGGPFLLSNQQASSPFRTVALSIVSGPHLQLELRTSGTTSTANSTRPSANAWHHYVITYDGTTGTLYVDGSSAATITLAGPLFQSSAPLTLGDVYAVNNFGFIGYGRAFGVWSRGLTAAEVTALYNSGVANDYPFAPVAFTASGKKTFAVDNTYGPALTNFQQRILISASNFDFTKPKADGTDLRVYAADGVTALNFWREYYDPVNGQASLWVKIPSLSAGQVTSLQVGWDGSSSDASSYDNTLGKLSTDASTLALYHCDDGTGTTITDSTGTYNGTLTGGTWDASDGGNFRNQSPRQAFASGSSLVFDGTDDYATFGSLLNTWPAAGTIAFWFRPDMAFPPNDSTYRRLFTKYNTNEATNPTQGVDLFFDTVNGNLVLGVAIGVAFANKVQILGLASSFASGVWHHCAVTWDTNVWSLYVDGALNGQNAVNSGGGSGGGFNAVPATGSANPLTFGAFNSGGSRGNYFQGAIDEIYVSSRRALPEEIHAMFRRRQYKAGMEQSGRWDAATRQSVILPTGGSTFDKNGTLEPTVFTDSGGIVRLYYTGGNPIGGTDAIGEASGTDGLTFTRYGSNPVQASEANQSFYFQHADGTYYGFFVNGYGTGKDVYRTTSSDGLTWAAATSVLTHGTQAWMLGCSNVFIYRGASMWYMLLECLSQSSPVSAYSLGLFTSTDKGLTWAAYARNPLSSLQIGTGSYSGAAIVQSGGLYHMLYHTCPNGALSFPSLLSYATSPNLYEWTVQAGSDPVLFFAGEVFSAGSAVQLADPDLHLDFAGEVRVYYDVDRDNTGGGGIEARSDVARFAGTLTQLTSDWPVIHP